MRGPVGPTGTRQRRLEDARKNDGMQFPSRQLPARVPSMIAGWRWKDRVIGDGQREEATEGKSTVEMTGTAHDRRMRDAII